MDFTSLRYFIVTAQTEHMTRAAQILHITQPTLSTAIRRLEAELGCQLFYRTGRGIQLNNCGRIFLEHAVQVDQIMSSCLTALREQEHADHFIRIACSRAPTNSQLLSRLLSEGINLAASTIPRNWESELIHNNLDLVITFGRTARPGLEHDLLCHHRAVVVAGKGHPLAGREVVTPEELNCYPFCSNSAPHSLTYMARAACEAYGFSPRTVFQGRDASDMLSVIRSNRCLGLMLERHLQNREDLVILPVRDFYIAQPLFLYWRKSDMGQKELTSVRNSIIDFYRARETE